MITLGPKGPCHHCGAEPGERHRDADDIALCRTTGVQFIQCGGENHIYNGRWYGEHDGPCEPNIWSGYWPGIEECHEWGWFTAPDSIWGEREDLNRLHVDAVWDSTTERYVKR